MAVTGQPLMPLVGDYLAGKTHQRHHAPQEDVDFPVVGKAFQNPGADEPVVGVVEDDVGPQGVHQVIESLGGKALEKCVCVPAAPHAVYHLGTLQILAHHFIHGVDVVLAVAVDGDGDIAAAAVQGFHQTGQHGVLVAAVPALRDPDEMLILFCKPGDELPCLIPGAVVDKQHPALVADQPCGGQVVNLL